MSLQSDRREPAFNAPGVVLALSASIPLLYLVQSRLGPGDPAAVDFGLVPVAVRAGEAWRLLTVILVHGSWSHALLNALGALTFGVPVARRLGRSAWGAARFLGFYLVCGLLASLGYLAANWSSATLLVGASGAIYGLVGASSRLIGRPGELAPFTSRSVVGMALAFGAINFLTTLRWVDVGTGGAAIAWQAHLFGYAAGLALIGPASRLATPRL